MTTANRLLRYGTLHQLRRRGRDTSGSSPYPPSAMLRESGCQGEGVWLLGGGSVVARERECGYRVEGVWLLGGGSVVARERECGYRVEGVWLPGGGSGVVGWRKYGYQVTRVLPNIAI